MAQGDDIQQARTLTCRQKRDGLEAAVLAVDDKGPRLVFAVALDPGLEPRTPSSDRGTGRQVKVVEC
jgi:hypothetical protein